MESHICAEQIKQMEQMEQMEQIEQQSKTAVFTVDLCLCVPLGVNEDYYDTEEYHDKENISVSDNSAAIIKWYEKYIPYIKDDFDIKSISHIRDNRFQITYTKYNRPYLGEGWLLEDFLNFDDDGNHPITISGSNYLVNGYFVE